MQTFVSNFSFIIVMIALFAQMIWMAIARKARDAYLQDLVSFKTPSSGLSRYYRWRVSTVLNTIIDGVVFELILIATLFVLIFMSISLNALYLFLPVLVFVLVLSSLSTIQGAYRINNSKKLEDDISARLESATDKIGTARGLVIPLVESDRKENGRIWYVLYRIAQRQDSVGWSIRDVLLDKGLKERTGSLEPGAPSRKYGAQDSDTGIGIA